MNHDHIIFGIIPRESLIEFLAVIVALGTIVMLWRNRKSLEVKYLIFLEILSAVWAFTYGMEFLTHTLEKKIFWTQLSYFGVSFLPVLYFLFTTAFSQKLHIIKPLNVILLSVIPFLTIPLALTNEFHHLIWKNVTLDAAQNMTLVEYGSWFWIFWSYSILLILGGLYNLLHSIYEFTSYYKSQVNILLVATLIPLMGNIMYVTGLNPIPGFDWTPTLFVFSGLIITFGIIRYRMFDLVPFARNALIDTMKDGVIVINSEGFIEDCNPAIYRIFNLKGKSIIRKHFSNIFSHYEKLVSALRGEDAKLFEIELPGVESQNYFQVRMSPVFNRNQQFSGYLMQMVDITSLKQIENKIKTSNKKLKTEVEERGRLIEDLDAFAHAVAHDLRNSLGSVYSSCEVMQQHIEEGETQLLSEMAGLIKVSAQKAMNITHELLILATVSHQEIEGKPLDMARIFSDAKYQVKDSITKSKARISTPEAWPVALGYAPWVEEVWANYLTNAIKYGGFPPEIVVGGDASENGKVKFWIQDNGDGIAPENQPRLFKKYTRLSPEKADGYGLGLSIVKRIVEKLDGRIGVESTGKKGEGATFWFELPKAEHDESSH